MIYDCFLFFNEIDLLDIRLNLMYNYVDKFIISECDTTFSGIKKGFNFEYHRYKFSKFEDKIIYVKHYDSGEYVNIKNIYEGRKGEIMDKILSNYNIIKDTPETDNGKSHWCRDYLHRAYVELGMDVCNDDDIIIFSDLDEMPNPDKLVLDGGSYVLNQRNMIYYMSMENKTDKWYGSFITKYSNIRNNSLGIIRRDRIKNFKILDDAGWHLTFMGGVNRVSQKLMSYAHQEYNNTTTHNKIQSSLKNGVDILGRGISINRIKLDDYYPSWMIKFIEEKYDYLLTEGWSI